MSTDHKRWAIASSVAVITIVLVVVFKGRLAADFWPLDSSRIGPNLVASLVQWAVVLIVATLLYPPWRRAVERFLGHATTSLHEKLDTIIHHHQSAHRKLDSLTDTVDALASNHEALHRSVKSLHEKLDASSGDS